MERETGNRPQAGSSSMKSDRTVTVFGAYGHTVICGRLKFAYI